MKKVLLWGGTALAVTAMSLFLAGSVLAEEPVANEKRPDIGGRTPWSHIGRGAGLVWDAVADLLGISQDEIAAIREEGGSLVDIAAERGVTDEELATAVTTAAEKAIRQHTEERYAGLTWAGLDERLAHESGRRGDRLPTTRRMVPEAVSELLGMTNEEIHAARADGMTLADIALDKGLSEEDLLRALTAEATAAIESALTEGDLTEEQAEWLLSRQATLAGYEITDPFAPGDGWPKAFGARGMAIRAFRR